jgi:hypothetical protein
VSGPAGRQCDTPERRGACLRKMMSTGPRPRAAHEGQLRLFEDPSSTPKMSSVVGRSSFAPGRSCARSTAHPWLFTGTPSNDTPQHSQLQLCAVCVCRSACGFTAHQAWPERDPSKYCIVILFSKYGFECHALLGPYGPEKNVSLLQVL